MNAIVCGTTAGYRQHQRNRTTPCKKCRAAQAAYMRNYRHQNGHNKARLVPDHIIQQHGIKGEHVKYIYRQVSNCGTEGGYQTHRKINEDPCDACREAHNTKMREYRRSKGLTTTTLMPVNLKCSNCGHDVARQAA